MHPDYIAYLLRAASMLSRTNLLSEEAALSRTFRAQAIRNLSIRLRSMNLYTIPLAGRYIGPPSS